MSSDLDREIDEAVRSMLDAEPAAAFRARVMAEIRADRPRRAWMSLAVPLASAAIVILLISVFTPWRHTQTPVPFKGQDLRLPAPPNQIAEQRRALVVVPPPVERHGRAPQRRGVGVAHATPLEEPAEGGIDALAAPAPLSIGTLPAPKSTAMPSIQPAPLRVNALDLPALEMPRDAARGEDR